MTDSELIQYCSDLSHKCRTCKYYKNECNDFMKRYYGLVPCMVNTIKQGIQKLETPESMPAGDWVPVIRCRRCLWFDEFHNICRHKGGLKKITAVSFCPNGEKKNG